MFFEAYCWGRMDENFLRDGFHSSELTVKQAKGEGEQEHRPVQ